MTCRELIAEINPETYLLPEEHDDALIGYVEQWNAPITAIYSAEKVVESLQTDGLSHEDAWEYFEFNIAGAYIGQSTPLFLRKEMS